MLIQLWKFCVDDVRTFFDFGGENEAVIRYCGSTFVFSSDDILLFIDSDCVVAFASHFEIVNAEKQEFKFEFDFRL